MTYTNGDAQCTANFVFTDGTDVFLGQAAHCAGTGSSTEVNGCEAPSLPLGTPVEIEGADNPGTLAYSSWLTMQEKGEKDPNACQYNDFALVKLDPADVGKANPTMPFYGGPTGVDPDGTAAGEMLFGYGNSSLRGGIAALRPKTGASVGTSGEGWTHTVATAGPGIPGDSGSGYLSKDGSALGVLSTLNLAPAAGTNGVSDLRSALDYANGPGGYDGSLELVDGQKPFNPNVVPVDLGG
ncbi:serine protease [Pseudonocardia sp. C8]|nr:serine protease [Pseudonocardia sp. C8]